MKTLNFIVIKMRIRTPKILQKATQSVKKATQSLKTRFSRAGREKAKKRQVLNDRLKSISGMQNISFFEKILGKEFTEYYQRKLDFFNHSANSQARNQAISELTFFETALKNLSENAKKNTTLFNQIKEQLSMENMWDPKKLTGVRNEKDNAMIKEISSFVKHRKVKPFP
jgi:hypothetical protein